MSTEKSWPSVPTGLSASEVSSPCGDRRPGVSLDERVLVQDDLSIHDRRALFDDMLHPPIRVVPGPAETPVRTHDPVTRHCGPERIRVECVRHGPARFRSTDGLGDPPVRTDHPSGDSECGHIDGLLEVRPAFQVTRYVFLGLHILLPHDIHLSMRGPA